MNQVSLKAVELMANELGYELVKKENALDQIIWLENPPVTNADLTDNNGLMSEARE